MIEYVVPRWTEIAIAGLKFLDSHNLSVEEIKDTEYLEDLMDNFNDYFETIEINEEEKTEIIKLFQKKRL